MTKIAVADTGHATEQIAVQKQRDRMVRPNTYRALRAFTDVIVTSTTSAAVAQCARRWYHLTFWNDIL